MLEINSGRGYSVADRRDAKAPKARSLSLKLSEFERRVGVRSMYRAALVVLLTSAVLVVYQNCGVSHPGDSSEGSQSGGSQSSSFGSDSGGSEGVIDAVKILADWKLSPNSIEFNVDVNQAELLGSCDNQENSLLIYRLKHRDVVLHESQSWCRQAQFTVDLRPMMNLPCGEWATLEGQMGRETGAMAKINRRCHQPEAVFTGDSEARKTAIETALHLESEAAGEFSGQKSSLSGAGRTNVQSDSCRILKPRGSERHQCEVICLSSSGQVARKASFESPYCE